jgi:UTP--glucose-1-phosphate uridylyltransferase
MLQIADSTFDAVPRDRLDSKFAPFAEKMRREGQPEQAIQAFRYYYGQLAAGATGYVDGSMALPVDKLPSSTNLTLNRMAGVKAMKRAAVIKLNGGLGTTMGMHGPKSLLEVKQGLTFLDIICHQVLNLRRTHSIRLPLLLMNSYNTHRETSEALAAYPEMLNQDVPASFLQHKVPRICKEDLTIANWPADRSKEWCPPGHGDLYLTLQTTGVLQALLDRGYEYAMISNADNLGATLDPSILGYFVENRMPFLMEVVRRRQADSKGGHLAHHPEHGLILRELAQCPPQEMAEFQNVQRYKYFNTNNLWVHLASLQHMLAAHNGLLQLPLICNEKLIDLARKDAPRVYQLETAVGHAVGVFRDAQALEVTRERFRPVKTTNDLVALWSDVYLLRDDYTFGANPTSEFGEEPIVHLERHYHS